MSNYTQLSPFVFDCASCPTRCDGQSKLNYQFASDVAFAEIEENLIITRINQHPAFTARKTTEAGYPDIEIFNEAGELHSYVEVKAQRRTFMIVKKLLPEAALTPSETLALNLSDLLRYFDIEEKTKVPTSIVWVLMNRPCIVAQNEKKYYFQRTTVLREIYEHYQNNRRFRRKSGKGDVVNGEHKGVVVNYHFSITELLEWNA